MFRDSGRQKLLVALASIRQGGNGDEFPGTRNQKRAFVNVACRRKFIIWRGPALRYQLTRRGERFLAKHTETSAASSHLKFVLTTRLAMAGCMLAAIGLASADWFEAANQHSPASALVVGTSPESDSADVAHTPVSTGSLRPETMPGSPPVDNRLDPSPGNTTPGLPAGAFRAPHPSKASHSQHQRDRVRRLQRTQPANVENGRGSTTQDPAWGNFGYGWNPYPLSPWPSR
jgi:hypothetical protein